MEKSKEWGNILWEVVQSKINRFLDLADRYVMTVMVASPSDYMRVEDSEHLAPFQRAELMETVYSFLGEVIGKYGNDRRIIAWDLWNEAAPQHRGCLEKMFAHARSLKPSQPLTACWEAFDLSDVITFHNYTQPGSPDRYHNQSGGSLEFLPELERALSYGRPALCTECLARSEGNTFENFLPYFQKYEIGFYFWGLCAGSARYHFPWNWPEGAPEPPNWFHCILYPDGTPYREKEIRLLRDFAAQKELVK